MQHIKNHIADKTPINTEWECFYCHEKNKGNLIQYATDAQGEYQMEKCRADIALLGQESKPFAVIEIVVTHKPKEATINYYKENKIVLIQIELDNEDDLDNIETKINKPTSINYCYNPKCPNIGEYTYQRRAVVFDTKHGYFHFMRTCIAEIYHYFGLYTTNDFTDEEIEFAKSNGVVFKDKTIICPNCRPIRYRSRGRSHRF